MKCKVCKKPRQMPKKHYFAVMEWERDPYCSRKCCEKDHGIVHRKGHTSAYYVELP